MGMCLKSPAFGHGRWSVALVGGMVGVECAGSRSLAGEESKPPTPRK